MAAEESPTTGSERINELVRDWEKKINDFDPTVSLIIRGHLLLEGQINLYLERKLENAKFVNGFRFRAKVDMVRALSKEGETEEELWQLILLLNTLRNKAAHKVEDENRTARIDALYKVAGVLAKVLPKALSEIAEEVKVPSEIEYQIKATGEIPEGFLIRVGFACAYGILAGMAEKERKET